MIEQGIVLLVQADSTVASLCSGGYFAQLPPNAPLPSWSYVTVSRVDAYCLKGVQKNKMRRLQLDVYGSNAADVLTLSNAIASVLSGYQGTLPDPDSTYVQGCFLSDQLDFFDDTVRTYRRMLEFEVYFE